MSKAIRRYFIENPPAVYVIGFMALLIACAPILASSPTDLTPADLTPADNLALYAYYLLALGAVLQLVELTLRGERRYLAKSQTTMRTVLTIGLMMLTSAIAVLGLAMTMTALAQIKGTGLSDHATSFYVTEWGDGLSWDGAHLTMVAAIVAIATGLYVTRTDLLAGFTAYVGGLVCILGRATIVPGKATAITGQLAGVDMVLWKDLYASVMLMTAGVVITSVGCLTQIIRYFWKRRKAGKTK